MDLEAKAREYSAATGTQWTAQDVQNWYEIEAGNLTTDNTQALMDSLLNSGMLAPESFDTQSWADQLNSFRAAKDALEYHREKGTLSPNIDFDIINRTLEEALDNFMSLSSVDGMEEGMSTSNSPVSDTRFDLGAYNMPDDFYDDFTTSWSTTSDFDELNAMLSFFDPAQRTSQQSFAPTSPFHAQARPLGPPQSFAPVDVFSILDQMLGVVTPDQVNFGALRDMPMNIDPSVFDRMGRAISEVVGRDPYASKDSSLGDARGSLPSNGYGQGNYMSRSNYGRGYDYFDGYSGKGGFDSPSESARGGSPSSGYAYGDRGGNEGAYDSKDSGLGGTSTGSRGGNEGAYSSKDSGLGGSTSTGSTSGGSRGTGSTGGLASGGGFGAAAPSGGTSSGTGGYFGGKDYGDLGTSSSFGGPK